MNRRIYSRFQSALRNQPPLEISEVHLAETMQSARIAYQTGRRREHSGYRDFLLRQVRLAGLPVWLLQGGLLFLMLGLSGCLLEGIQSRHLPLLLGCLAVLTAMTGIPWLGRSVRHRMLEVEMATRMSLSGLFLSRMLIISAGDVLVLGLALLMASARTDFSGAGILAYLLLPYLMACCGCVLIQIRVHGRHQAFMSSSFGCLLIAMLLMLYKVFPRVYGQASLGIWEALWPLFALLLGAMLGLLLKRASSLDLSPAAEI